MACILCDSADGDVVSEFDRHGVTLVTRLCGGCGLVCNDPIPNDSELSEFYARRYWMSYKGSFQPRGRQIVRNFRRVAEHFRLYKDLIRPARSVLEIGAGSGEFLFGVAASARLAIGIEPNREYADYCRTELNLDVRTDPSPEAGCFITVTSSISIRGPCGPLRAWLASMKNPTVRRVRHTGLASS